MMIRFYCSFSKRVANVLLIGLLMNICWIIKFFCFIFHSVSLSHIFYSKRKEVNNSLQVIYLITAHVVEEVDFIWQPNEDQMRRAFSSWSMKYGYLLMHGQKVEEKCNYRQRRMQSSFNHWIWECVLAMFPFQQLSSVLSPEGGHRVNVTVCMRGRFSIGRST